MEKTLFAYICPNCHKPITSRLEKFKCWYCNTYYEDTKTWEIKELTETELSDLQGKSTVPVTPVAPAAPVVTPPAASATPVAAPVAQPKTEEMLESLNNKPWEFKWEKLAYTWQAVIAVLTGICILVMFIDPTPRGIIQTVLGLLIGWFWTGPWCWKIAYEKGRNQTWAFSVGFFFAIPGAIVYWIYLLFFKQIKVVPLQ
jgi:hypothetical protein